MIMTDHRAVVRHSHGDGHRRRRHAGRRLHAQQLLGLGGLGDRLHARQRPADRHRRAGRLQRRDPQLHHVPRHEPQVPGGHRSAASAPAAVPSARPAARTEGEVVPIEREEASPALLANAEEVIIVPGYGMAVAQAQHIVYEITKALRAKGDQRALRHPPGRRTHARSHERAAGRGQGALRHRVRDGRDQRRFSRTSTCPWSSAPTTSSTRPRRTDPNSLIAGMPVRCRTRCSREAVRLYHAERVAYDCGTRLYTVVRRLPFPPTGRRSNSRQLDYRDSRHQLESFAESRQVRSAAEQPHAVQARRQSLPVLRDAIPDPRPDARSHNADLARWRSTTGTMSQPPAGAATTTRVVAYDRNRRTWN